MRFPSSYGMAIIALTQLYFICEVGENIQVLFSYYSSE